MKILFVSAVLPYPLHSGGQIRIYNLLKRLSKNHEIHLYSFIRADSEKKYLPELSFCKKVVMVHRGRVWQPKYVLKTLTSSYPLLWSSYHNAEMLSLLADEVAQGGFDLLHIEPGYVWPSIPSAKRVPIVVAEHNVEHEVYEAYVRQFPVGPLRPFLSLDVAKMKLWEKRMWEKADAIVAVSENDKQKIGAGFVVPNGVDTKAFAFRPKKTMSKNLTFLYVGNFRWMENRDAVQYLISVWWPAIQKKYPRATLRIVGRNAPKGRYFVGDVEDVRDELYKADILVAPIRIGGGTKFKLLEAMAAGLPVITTPVGAEGIEDAQVQLAEKPEDVLRSIAWLSVDKNRLTMTAAARKIIEKNYSWDLIAQKLDYVWTSLS